MAQVSLVSGEAPSGSVPVIDVTKAGFYKVLGKGRIGTPVLVRARFFSKQAEDKIKAAGGSCELTV